MDKLTVDKMATAVLSSLLLLAASNAFVEIGYPTGRNAQEPAGGRTAAPVAGTAPAKTEPPAPAASAVALLAEASPAQGEKAARKCTVCHSLEPGGPVKVGPDLYDIVGRKTASAPGFSYSPALMAKDGVWTYEALDVWITNPAAAIPGSRMAFSGIASPRERADLLAYLRSLSPSPRPLPAAPPPAPGRK